MGLTEKMKAAALKGWNDGMGMFPMGLYAAVEAALKEQAEQLKKAEDGWARALDKLNDCQTKRGDLIDENHRLRKQASAAEQGQACTNCGHHNPHTSPAGDVADACNEADCNCGYYQPAHPPAGDVVGRMLDAFMPGWRCEPSPERQRKNMTAALAVAREGYVSLADVLGPVNDDDREAWMRTPLTSSPSLTMRSEKDADIILANRRVRLAKPAEQTDENRVAEIICKRMQSFHCVDTTLDKIAAEIVAALRDGKEGK